MHEFLREMNSQVLSRYGDDAIMTVGELPHTPDPKRVLDYVGRSDKQLSMVFQFDIVDIGQGGTHKYHFEEWKLPVLKKIVDKWQRFIEGTDGWTTAFCENHDQRRSISRFASDATPEHRSLSGKMLALMMCSLTGTLFIYQGQEIGMINVPKEWPIEKYKDIESVNFYKLMAAKTNNDPDEMAYVMRSLQTLSRDNARIPMQWDDGPYAGFTDRKEGAWAHVHDLYREINVAKQLDDPNSTLNFWKDMIRFRKQHSEVLVHGTFEAYDIENEKTFVFVKRFGSKRVVVALNFSSEEQEVVLPEYEKKKLEFMVGNYGKAGGEGGNELVGTMLLRPWEGRLYMATGGDEKGKVETS